MFSGQAAAPSLIAPGLSTDAGRLPHSLHGYFVRRGDSANPTQFQVDRDRDGRSFSARRVLARQNGEVIFSMSASFAVPASARWLFPDEEAEPVPDMPPVDSLVFCGPSGVPLRRSNFGKMSGWSHAVRSIGAEGLHFHGLRHTGNTFAAAGGSADARTMTTARRASRCRSANAGTRQSRNLRL